MTTPREPVTEAAILDPKEAHMQEPRLVEIKDGWAALGDGWAVFGKTPDDARERYVAADEKHAELRARAVYEQGAADPESDPTDLATRRGVPPGPVARNLFNAALEEIDRLRGVVPDGAADPECGERNHAGSHPCNAPKGHPPGPEQGGHYCRYAWPTDRPAPFVSESYLDPNAGYAATDPEWEPRDIVEAVDHALLFVLQLSNREHEAVINAAGPMRFIAALEQDGYTVAAVVPPAPTAPTAAARLRKALAALRKFYGIDVLREMGVGEPANEEMALWRDVDRALLADGAADSEGREP